MNSDAEQMRWDQVQREKKEALIDDVKESNMSDEVWKAEGFELENRREVTLSELDEAVKQVKEARHQYDLAKAVSNERYKVVEELENNLITLLDLANRVSYEAEGIGRATLVTKTSVTVPKDLSDKKALFDWIREKHGEEGVLSYLTINYQTLNGLYNQEALEAREKNIDFSIDGLGLPTVTKTLQLRSR